MKLDIDWKKSLPLALLLLIASIAVKNGIAVDMNSVLGIFILAVLIVLILPVLNACGVSEKFNKWVVGAVLLMIAAVSLSLLPSIIDVGGWIAQAKGIVIGIAGIVLIIGALLSLKK